MRRILQLNYIQAMLGHVKLDTTQIYTQVSIKKLKEIHTLTHPAKAKRSKNIDLIMDEPESSEDKFLSVLEEQKVEDDEIWC